MKLEPLLRRVMKLEERVTDNQDELAGNAIDGVGRDLSSLEASLHEICHVVTLRGSLPRALRKPIESIDSFVDGRKIYGVARDSNEVSTIAVGHLVAELLGHPTPLDRVIDYAKENGNVRHFRDREAFAESVARRLRNPRCIALAKQIANYLRPS